MFSFCIHYYSIFCQPIDLPENVTMFSPKVICILSTQPFYRAMRGFLSQSYSMSLSQLSYPLEYYIAALVSHVPLPWPGGRSFHYIQDIALINTTSKSLPPLIFDLPNASISYPFLDLDFSSPLRCLSISNLLVVFILLLRESKIVFICQSNNIMTEVMETLKHLLFPLTWATTYVSRLPHSLMGLFEALGGFMIGYNLVEESNCDRDFNWSWSSDNSIDNNNSSNDDCGNTNKNKDNKKKKAKSNQNVDDNSKNSTIDIEADFNNNEWIDSLAPCTYVIDLTGNMIYYTRNTRHHHHTSPSSSSSPSDHKLQPLTVSEKAEFIATLPHQSFLRIQDKLTKICQYYSVGPQRSGFDQFDR